MEYRPPQPEEREDITDVFESTDGEEGRTLVGDVWDMWMGFGNAPRVLVQENVVGFLNSCFLKDVMWIEDFRIHKTYQRRGYGTSMVEYCLKEAVDRGCTVVGLDVYSDNTGALTFYDHLSFTRLFEYLRVDITLPHRSPDPLEEVDGDEREVWDFITSSPEYRNAKAFFMLNHCACPLTREDIKKRMEKGHIVIEKGKDIESVILFEVCPLWVDGERILLLSDSRSTFDPVVVVNGIYGRDIDRGIEAVFNVCAHHNIHSVRAYPLWGSTHILTLMRKGFTLPSWERGRHFVVCTRRTQGGERNLY